MRMRIHIYPSLHGNRFGVFRPLEHEMSGGKQSLTPYLVPTHGQTPFIKEVEYSNLSIFLGEGPFQKVILEALGL